jgi:hypothetical protein
LKKKLQEDWLSVKTAAFLIIKVIVVWFQEQRLVVQLVDVA